MGKNKAELSTSRPEDIIAMRQAAATMEGEQTLPDMEEAAEVIEATIVEPEPTNLPAVQGPASDRDAEMELSPAQQATMQRVFSWLEMHQDHAASPDAAVADIISQIMSADSVDEVLADVAAIGLRELENVPLTIHDGKFNRSEYEAGMPWYAVLDVTRLDTNQRITTTTGAQTIIAQLIRMIELDGFPANVVCVKATKKPTRGGYWPLKLSPIK